MEQHYSQIPEKPLIAGMSNRIESATKIFFFERSDGKTIAVQEPEAWSLWTRRPQMLSKGSRRPEFKLIGVGDGLIFAEARRKAQEAGLVDVQEAKKILLKGEQDELQACKGVIIPPRNMDKLE